MNLKKKIVVFVCLMCAVLLSACGKVLDDSRISLPPTITETPPSPSVPSVRIEKYVLQDEEYDISVEYPVISGLADADIEKKINEMLYKTYIGYVLNEDTRPNEDNTRCYIEYVDAERFSVSFFSTVYYTGAAHPLFPRGATNIDLRTGEIIPLESVVDIDALRNAFDAELFEVSSGNTEAYPSSPLIWGATWFEQYYLGDEHVHDFWYNDDYLYVVVQVQYTYGYSVVLRTALSNVKP
ncbi:MAG: DUF4163 domain-containing protein [Oscillospiraceae bacterium]|jgi:hypothetical protein|nr:DUF4163 domain-containing protein [Oscillospiraceae bacterium]